MSDLLRIDNTSRESIVESLENFAKDLILNKVIIINDSKFSIIDIEIYYWYKNHPDEYAKGVEHTRPFGEFEMHRYGVDISLGNNENVGFGGALIRGLYDLNELKPIKKTDVVRSIFNKLALGSNRFELITEKTPWIEIFRSKRLNLGVPDDAKSIFFDAPYKFMAKDVSIFKNYPDKEQIFKSSNLKDSDLKDLLGYTLKR
ncbi:MAG TPA: hypothetical protein PK784_08265 [Tenuifilaceae bacterium]|nr:hypothetical protein [Tenuifilaceae bacterium]HPN22784.1 hypothetical protein [Tenuifilaceae bacterium]